MRRFLLKNLGTRLIGELSETAACRRFMRGARPSNSVALWPLRSIAQILKGASPGEIPISHPTKFALGDQPQGCQAIGLTIPPSLLARADEVIE